MMARAVRPLRWLLLPFGVGFELALFWLALLLAILHPTWAMAVCKFSDRLPSLDWYIGRS